MKERRQNDPNDFRTINLIIEFFINCTCTSKQYTLRILNETWILLTLKDIVINRENQTLQEKLVKNMCQFLYNIMELHGIFPPQLAEQTCLKIAKVALLKCEGIKLESASILCRFAQKNNSSIHEWATEDVVMKLLQLTSSRDKNIR